MRHLVVLVALAASSSLGLAQLRTIPRDAEPGLIRHLEAMTVEIDGKPRELSPGAQIRDEQNRVVLPASLAERTLARYLLDRDGMVHRVWILTPQEAAALPPDPIPK